MPKNIEVKNLLGITPEDVVNSYLTTGLTPVFSDWGDQENCGCGLSAYVIANTGQKPNIHEDINLFMDNIFGIEHDHPAIPRFTSGFDGDFTCLQYNNTPEHTLGLACRAAVLAHPKLALYAKEVETNVGN